MRLAQAAVYRITLLIALLPAVPVQAETPLAQAFAAAWQRQPVAAGLGERVRAAEARQAAASTWTAAPPSVEVGSRSDRYNRNRGAQEQEFGLVLPLWLPGERGASQSLADAERQAVERRGGALRLQLAQAVRDAWWAWLGARNEAALAGERVAAAGRLRDDVAHRFRAGDLSRADLNAAEGAQAQAEALAAESEVGLAQARYRLQALTGAFTAEADPGQAEPLPPASFTVDHPQWQEMQAQAARAEAEAELARQQTRANPELALSTRRERAATGEPTDQTWALSLRLPFGGGPRQDARVATARAEALELRGEAERQRERLVLEGETGRAQVEAARRQLAAAENRARLARENRALYDKSFRLGESDLPTRLRIESETFEAERALGRARIALAQGVSQWRQALGLLPE